MMSRVKKGLMAGFAATLAVSILEISNMAMGSPVMAFPTIVAGLLGMPDNMVVGWIGHLFAGTVILGGLFGLLCDRIPGYTPATKGITFAVGAMAAMMVVIVLFASPGVLGGPGGFGTIGWMLVTHAVFGIVLGTVYGTLVTREKRGLRAMNDAAAVH